MRDIEYRRGALADLGAAVQLRWHMTLELNGVDSDIESPSWRDRFIQFYAPRVQEGSAALFFAEHAGTNIGVSIAYKLVNHRSQIYEQQSAYISSVYVSPEYRLHGIASKLTMMAVDWARDSGCSVARLRTSPMGRPVYAKLGFQPSDEMEFKLAARR